MSEFQEDTPIYLTTNWMTIWLEYSEGIERVELRLCLKCK